MNVPFRKGIPLFLCLIVLGISSYYYAGSKIIYDQQLPPECDYIFTFGMANERYQYSEELFYTYNKPLWIISDPIAYIAERLIEKGIASSDIHPFFTAQSTYDELLYLRNYLTEREQRSKPSVLLVSSASHLGRIKLLVSRMGIDGLATIHYSAVPQAFESQTRPALYQRQWWRYSNLRKEVFNYWATMLIHWW